MSNKTSDDGSISKRVVDVVYVSNDKSLKEFEDFVSDQSQPWAAIPLNDDRIVDLKNFYQFTSVPQVVILDKNLKIVSTEAADDLIKLTPYGCRSHWISELQQRLGKQEFKDDEF